MVWVLKELEPENWVNNGGTDFAVQLKAPNVQDVIQKVSWQFRLLSLDAIFCSRRQDICVYEEPGRVLTK